MKIKTLFRLLTIAALVLFVIPSCVKEGPAGMDGVDGTAGADGADGADGTAFCLDCHNDTKMSLVESQYETSVHGTSVVQFDGRYTYQYAGEGKSRVECATCHTEEGFIDRIASGLFFYRDTANGLAYPSAIGCDACHSGLHLSFDQETDGVDYALRTTDAVIVRMDEGNTIDLSGPSNLCVNCHQARTAYPEADTDGNFKITSVHYGPHHGPQGNMIVGKIGYQFSGSVNYPETGNTATAHAVAGCTTCHMNDGNHSFEPMLDACAQCHGDVTDFDIDGVQTEVTALLTTLESKLEEKGVMSDGEVVPATYEVTLARAYYNYILCEEDRSEGVHNPEYIKALLTNTIEALQ